jgi:hypothetical protein
MECGSLCHIRSKKNSINSYVVLYSDINELMEARTKRNEWLPSIVSQTNINVNGIKEFTIKPVKQYFAVLDKKQDCYGNFYYRCLYNDSHGWIIENRKSFELEKEI